ncbi:ribosomal protein L35 [Acrasis kona]|uniref:Ribosomal protein L35 n=1 Tax=Acrasis kona TaxID=1008807 RepID=A0AAW2ZFR6_9EUKA
MVNSAKAYELRKLNRDDLQKELDNYKEELYTLRVSKVASGNQNSLLNISKIRKSIARVHTILTERQKAEVNKLYANKKRKPLDLRSKQTRAYRRRVTWNNIQKVSLKKQKKRDNFPKRKYAVNA